MRSLLLLVLVAGAFLALVLRPHLRAGSLLEREERALLALRAIAADGREAEAAGYRFGWRGGGTLPRVCVARPVRPGEDGVRWFVTADGTRIFEFDTVAHHAGPEGPDVDELRRRMARAAAEREPVGLPSGWRVVP